MKQLNNGLRHVSDDIDVLRIAFLIEETDVGSYQPHYLGQGEYTFEISDVGRLIEVVTEKSPGSVSWYFGSVFPELRKEYPQTKPYIEE